MTGGGGGGGGGGSGPASWMTIISQSKINNKGFAGKFSSRPDFTRPAGQQEVKTVIEK